MIRRRAAGGMVDEGCAMHKRKGEARERVLQCAA